MNSQNWLATSPRVGGSEETAAQLQFSWQKGLDTRRRASGWRVRRGEMQGARG